MEDGTTFAHDRGRVLALSVDDVPDGAVGVLFKFHLTARITGGEFSGVPPKVIRGAALEFQWPAPPPPPATLSVRFTDGEPRLAAVHWLRPETKIADLLADVPEDGNRFCVRRQRIAQHTEPGSPLRRMSEAMCRFDEATDADDLRRRGMSDRADAILALLEYLRVRTLQRASWTLRGLPFEPD